MEALQALVDAGGDVNAADRDGWTPLLVSAWEGHEGVVQLLAALDGVDLDATVRRGEHGGWGAARLAEASSGAGGLRVAEVIRQQVCVCAWVCACVRACPGGALMAACLCVRAMISAVCAAMRWLLRQRRVRARWSPLRAAWLGAVASGFPLE